MKIIKSSEIWNYSIILLFSIVPYLPSIFGDFIFDDAETVKNNRIVNGKDSIFEIFERDFWGNPIKSQMSHKSYRPITTFTFWLNFKLHGFHTFGYHLINQFLHSLVTCLIYKFVKKIENIFSTGLENLALPTALLFAAHPIHTEAISNITGRSELLMTMFGLLALINLESSRFYIFVTLSMFSKEQGITVVPIAIFFHFLASSHTKSAQIIKNKMAFLGALILLRLKINNFKNAEFTIADNPNAFIENPLLRLVNHTYIWLYNLYLLLNPTNLCFDYSMGAIEQINGWKDWRILSPAFVLIIAIGGLKIIIGCVVSVAGGAGGGRGNGFERGWDNRFLAFFIFLGVATFLPASNIFITVGFVVAERVLYFPSLTICVFGAIIYRTFEKKFGNLELIILLLAASGSWNRANHWRSELSLYSADVKTCPLNPKIHYNLAKVLRDLGDIENSKKSYWTALKLNPKYEQALNNLGNILESSGDSKTAETLLIRAVGIRPNFAAAWMNLGISQMHQGKYNESENSFLRSIELRKESPHCYFNLGILYQKTNRAKEALEAWKNAVRIDEKHTQAWTNLLVLLDFLNLCDDVIKFGTQALKNIPNVNNIYMQVGTCYAQKNDFENSERFIKFAIHLKPDSSLYRANLGVLYQRFNRPELAIQEYQNALDLDSGNQMAFRNLHKLHNRTSYF
ncbi:unnamed protein product [Caenorhabditis angaria]|uniref:dolichyl-phosphate-mannose--protein mannosyltransferase n=1 Tax=Caenorhabditis angaria TaxID=860376 RepID=A0A9P1J1U2_9PELO|nr:unnamed protein product [Caenorhabditis angaria]